MEYTVINQYCKSYIYFSKFSDILDYWTRTHDLLSAKHVKSDLEKNTISYRGPLIWNMITNNDIQTFQKQYSQNRTMNMLWMVSLSFHVLQVVKFCPGISTREMLSRDTAMSYDFIMMFLHYHFLPTFVVPCQNGSNSLACFARLYPPKSRYIKCLQIWSS